MTKIKYKKLIPKPINISYINKTSPCIKFKEFKAIILDDTDLSITLNNDIYSQIDDCLTKLYKYNAIKYDKINLLENGIIHILHKLLSENITLYSFCNAYNAIADIIFTQYFKIYLTEGELTYSTVNFFINISKILKAEKINKKLKLSLFRCENIFNYKNNINENHKYLLNDTYLSFTIGGIIIQSINESNIKINNFIYLIHYIINYILHLRKELIKNEHKRSMRTN